MVAAGALVVSGRPASENAWERSCEGAALTTSSSTPDSPATCADVNSRYRPMNALQAGSDRAPDDMDALRGRIRHLEDENAALQRSALLGSMSAMVAHEFNNLMTPVVARAQLALLTGEAPATRKALDAALLNAQKAIAITSHLLGIARNDTDPQTVCDVDRAIQAAVEVTARPLDRDGIELRLNVPAGLCVAARPILFEQVLLNLILNARAAMREHSGVLAISARREGDDVLIEICDAGSGMAAEHIERVLNPFLAADPLLDAGDWRAVGLGLNVCRTITRQHRASLRFRLNEGSGCTAELCWPAA